MKVNVRCHNLPNVFPCWHCQQWVVSFQIFILFVQLSFEGEGQVNQGSENVVLDSKQFTVNVNLCVLKKDDNLVFFLCIIGLDVSNEQRQVDIWLSMVAKKWLQSSYFVNNLDILGCFCTVSSVISFQGGIPVFV